jgi:hypothetical protein
MALFTIHHNTVYQLHVTCAGGTHARELVHHSERNMPLQMAVHNFFVGRGADMPAVHRLAILAPKGEIEHILTQMDILKFMHDRHASDAAAMKTLEEAGGFLIT